MAEITNFPELTDEMLQKFIGHALQQATREDTRSPLSSGLLSAGLAMMAGSRGRSFGEALGQGGLLGLQAYGAQKELAKKDPTQMINLLSAVQGLRTNQEKQQWLKDFPGGMGAPAQYAPQSDFAPGEAPGPVTPPMQPQMTAPPVAGQAIPMPKLMRGMALDIPLAKTLYEGYGKAPSKLGPGDIPQNFNPLTGQWEQGQPTPNLDRGMRMTPQGVQPEPGYPQAAAEIAGATTGAQEAAKAGQDVITVTEGGRPRNVTRAQWIAEQQKQGAPGEAEVVQAWREHQKNTPTQPFTFVRSQLLNPTAAESAASVKAAEAPITLSTEYEKGLQTQNLKLREAILEEDKLARANSANIDRFLQLNKDPNVAKGRFAETFSGLKNAAASFGVDVKGLPAEQAMQSISSQMALQLRNPASGGGMPGAMSDSDRNFLTAMTPSLAQSKEGRELVAETFQAVNNRKVEVSRLLLKHEMEGGKVDSAFLKKLADHADKNPIFGEEQQKKLTKVMEAPTTPAAPKVTGMTRNYHIDNILKNGSPEDIQKLRDRGLVQ